MVLSACSTYFEQLFLEHAEPPVTGPMIVIMRETSFDDLAIIVEFMYKGEINVSQVFFLFFLELRRPSRFLKDNNSIFVNPESNNRINWDHY